jgi:hypothetical protein
MASKEEAGPQAGFYFGPSPDWRHTQEAKQGSAHSSRAMGPQTSYFFLVVFLAGAFLAGAAFFAGAFLVAIVCPFSGAAGVWSHTIFTTCLYLVQLHFVDVTLAATRSRFKRAT